MKALSVHPFYGMQMFWGDKTIEWRSWDTPYRGEVLFCTTAVKEPGCISGHALFIATIADVHPFTKKDLVPACMDTMPNPRGFAWVLKDFHAVHFFPVKGKQGFFNVDDSLIRRLPDNLPEAESAAFMENEFRPLVYQPARL